MCAGPEGLGPGLGGTVSMESREAEEGCQKALQPKEEQPTLPLMQDSSFPLPFSLTCQPHTEIERIWGYR